MSLRSASTACSRRRRASTWASPSASGRAGRRYTTGPRPRRGRPSATHPTSARSSRSARSRRCSRQRCWRTWRGTGLVALDDPVQKHLPDGVVVPVRGRPITLADLASHTSGLPRLPKGLLPPAMLRERRNPYASVHGRLSCMPRSRRRSPGVAPGSQGPLLELWRRAPRSRTRPRVRARATRSSSPSASRGLSGWPTPCIDGAGGEPRHASPRGTVAAAARFRIGICPHWPGPERSARPSSTCSGFLDAQLGNAPASLAEAMRTTREPRAKRGARCPSGSVG